MENALNPLADLLERQTTKTFRKLSFEDQCAWYISMKLGISPLVASKCSGLGLPAMCYLRIAGEVRSGQVRYPKVALEYAQLGHEAFVHKYLTPRIRDRIAVAIEQQRVIDREKEHEPLNDQGYSPKAMRYCGRHEWPETAELDRFVFTIELCPDRGGYMWRQLTHYGEPEVSWDKAAYHPLCQLVGDPERGLDRGPDAKGFATSQDCFRHVQALFGRRREARR